jgi:hypothetical protein
LNQAQLFLVQISQRKLLIKSMFKVTYPRAMRVFSDFVMIFKSGRTCVAQAAS